MEITAFHRTPILRRLPERSTTDSQQNADRYESGTGLPHSKSWRVFEPASNFREVLECGSPVPLFPGSNIYGAMNA
jgi:hypothetical protein